MTTPAISVEECVVWLRAVAFSEPSMRRYAEAAIAHLTAHDTPEWREMERVARIVGTGDPAFGSIFSHHVWRTILALGRSLIEGKP